MRNILNSFDGKPHYGDRRIVTTFVITKKIGHIRKWFGRYAWIEEYRGPAAFAYWLPVKFIEFEDNY